MTQEEDKAPLRLGSVAKGLVSAAAVFGVLSWAAGPLAPELIQHGEAAPYRENAEGVREVSFAERLAKRKPEVVILGSSVTACAIDPGLLQERSGREVLDLTIAGGMSASWYLLMKNVIAKGTPKPKLVILGFRDVYLTVPDFRVEGRYKAMLDRYVDGPEPTLDRRAYLAKLGASEYFLRRHWAPFQRRDEIRDRVETWAKAGLPSVLLGRSEDQLRASVERVFAEENKLHPKVNTAEEKALGSDLDRHFEFDEVLAKSFLPDIIEIAKESGIQLAFVRMRPRRNAEPAEVQLKYPSFFRELLPGYEAKLDDYLEQQGVMLFDFTKDERIPLEWYARDDHLDFDFGRRGFTEILAGEMAAALDALD